MEQKDIIRIALSCFIITTNALADDESNQRVIFADISLCENTGLNLMAFDLHILNSSTLGVPVVEGIIDFKIPEDEKVIFHVVSRRVDNQEQSTGNDNEGVIHFTSSESSCELTSELLGTSLYRELLTNCTDCEETSDDLVCPVKKGRYISGPIERKRFNENLSKTLTFLPQGIWITHYNYISRENGTLLGCFEVLNVIN